MPNNEEIVLAKRIAKAYRASGIGAKTYGGQPFIEREDGWEGPLDPYLLQTTYLDEIDRIEQNVRTAIAECLNRMDSRLLEVIDRDMWVGALMSPEDFVELGFNEQKAKLYATVARQLHFRGELWR